MARKLLTAQQKLDNLTGAMVEDILSLSDEELRAEMIEDGLDPDEVGQRMNETIRNAIAEWHKVLSNAE